MERIRSWLTPALLAVIALLLYRLGEAIEDVADSIDDACSSADEPDARVADALLHGSPPEALRRLVGGAKHSIGPVVDARPRAR
jgi:hypothetical protein